MAKRFTDTTKWDDDWYLDLPPRMKCVWHFICDTCDGAGFKKISFAKLSRDIGEKIDRIEFDHHFESRVQWVKDDVVWIHGFIAAQYKKLSPANKAHANIAKLALRTIEGLELSAKAALVASTLSKLLQDNSDSQTTLERGSDEPRARDIGNRKKEIGKDLRKEGQGEKQLEAFPIEFDFEPLYAVFPRQRGKDLGMAALRGRVHDQATYDRFARAVRQYAKECRLERTDPKHIMYWSTFVGEPGNEPWIDFADKGEGEPKPQPPTPPRPDFDDPPPVLDVEHLRPEMRHLLEIVQKRPTEPHSRALGEACA